MDPRDAVWSRTEYILQCAVCTDMLQDARILSCGHSFCRLCIDQCNRHRVGLFSCGIKCPMCRKEFVVSTLGGKSEVPKNFIAEDMLAVVRTLRENQIIGDVVENTINQARVANDRPNTGVTRERRGSLCSYIFIAMGLVILLGIAGLPEEVKNLTTHISEIYKEIFHDVSDSEEEEKKDDWYSQVTEFIQQKICGPKIKEKKTSLEKLKQYFIKIYRRFCDALEKHRKKQKEYRR